MEAMTLSNLIQTLETLKEETGDIQVFSVIPNGFDDQGRISVDYDIPDVITNGEFALLSTKAVCQEIVTGSAAPEEATEATDSAEESPVQTEQNNPLA